MQYRAIVPKSIEHLSEWEGELLFSLIKEQHGLSSHHVFSAMKF
jgi:hypothetical protein